MRLSLCGVLAASGAASTFTSASGVELGCGSKHSLRCHVGRGCWRDGERLYRIEMPGLWQTRALAGDYHRRTGLQRCIRNEQQCNQRQTCYHQKIENWHCHAPTPQFNALSNAPFRKMTEGTTSLNERGAALDAWERVSSTAHSRGTRRTIRAAPSSTHGGSLCLSPAQ